VALAESRWRSDFVPCLFKVEDSFDSSPFARLVESYNCVLSRERAGLPDFDAGNKLGSSTKLGGWLFVGDDDAVARSISFSVCARCSMSFNRSLSD